MSTRIDKRYIRERIARRNDIELSDVPEELRGSWWMEVLYNQFKNGPTYDFMFNYAMRMVRQIDRRESRS